MAGEAEPREPPAERRRRARRVDLQRRVFGALAVFHRGRVDPDPGFATLSLRSEGFAAYPDFRRIAHPRCDGANEASIATTMSRRPRGCSTRVVHEEARAMEAITEIVLTYLYHALPWPTVFFFWVYEMDAWYLLPIWIVVGVAV